MMTINTQNIPDRSQPGLTMTAPSALHQDGHDEYNTGNQTSKIRGRDNITIGTWNIRTMRPAGKLKELTYEMDRNRWNLLGLCEVRWKNFGETTTEEGHKLYYKLYYGPFCNATTAPSYTTARPKEMQQYWIVL